MKKGVRFLSLALTLSLLVCLLSALSYDLNGDGKTNVWDLQLAVNQGISADEQTAALEEALGGPDELHPNSDGVYEIWSPVGLYRMASSAAVGNTYRLMADIDLNGSLWSPIPVFKGHLEGNGKTISNFTIQSSVSGSDGGSMGFIALLDHNGSEQSTVKNLNLQNVSLTVPAEEDVRYIGLLVGSNRGIVENCTTVGIFHDSRTSLENAAYFGTLVGRNNNSTPAGTVISGTDLLTATTGSSNSADLVTGLTSLVALDFATLAEGSKTRSIGIAGYTKSENIDTAMIWQDTSGSVTYQTDLEQSRRQVVVDEMYKMGTVRWTTSELLTYTSNKGTTSAHSNIYIPGRTYTGLPYNNCGGGYVRFLSVMQAETDSEGRYVTNTGLESGIEHEDGTDTGFTAYAGNDCSSAVGWAWAAVSPAVSSNPGVLVSSTNTMTPNAYNTKKYGVYPTGDYRLIQSDTTLYNSCQDARNTRTIIELNGGGQGMAEYYAKASRGDALLYKNTVYNETTGVWDSNGGHARLLAYDPMILRNYAGVVDIEASYVITHEQGDGLYDCVTEDGSYEQYGGYGVKQTSWRIDHKYTLSALTTQEGYTASKQAGEIPGSGWGYIPITIAAFTYEDTLRTPYYDAGYTDYPIVLPNSGWYFSNYMNVCGEMTILDASGAQVYQKTEYVAPDGRGNDYQVLKLEKLFPDATENLTPGESYTVAIRFLASNGTWTTKVKNKQFTYSG